MASVWEELKRRNVVRVAVAYVIIAWLILQVGDTLAPALRLTDWVNTVLAFFLILGFPMALFFAWAFELTPEGIKKEKDVGRSESVTHRTGRKLDYLIIGVLMVALGYFAYDKFVLSSSREMAKDEATTEKATAQPVAADKSIAVLPFVNMSDDPGNEYFSDGISEEILNLLAKVSELRVTSRSSAFSFKGQNVDMPTMAAKLNVAHVLEGSVRKSGNQLRITAQLIEVVTDTHLWSETYDRDLDDIFAVQDEIAKAVVWQLTETLLGPNSSRVPDTDQPDALDMDAYNSYLQGRYYLNRLGPENYRKAISYFELAVESAPYSALYWAGLSEANSLYGFLAAEGPHAALRRARQAAETALTIDDAIPEVHIAMARVRSFDWDWSGVEDSLRTALDLRPNDVSALEGLTMHLHRLYRLEDAISVAEKAIALDPLNVNMQHEYAQILFAADRVDDAEQIMRRLFSQDPSTSLTPFHLAWILAFSGRAIEAIEYAEMEPVDFLRFTGLAIAQHRAGNHDLSVVAQRKLLTICGEFCAYQQAQIHAVWGDADKSMEWLARAFELRDAGMALMKQDGALALLADDPRYIDLLERMGLAD